MGKQRAAVSPSKERGAFFTPLAASSFLAKWAIRRPADRVLEPSCGEASFLVSAAARLNELGHPGLFEDDQLVGVEIHEASAKQASANVLASGRSAQIRTADFFGVPASPEFDAVLGNPPFVRYQTFAGSGRERALRAALAAGVNLNGLASSWAAFVIHACQFLRRGGRLGFVLPAEVLTVNYAAPIREYLLRRFGKVRLVVFEELIFPDALEDVVLLMAEGQGGCSHFELHQVRNAEALGRAPIRDWSISPGSASKWSHALVEPGTWKEYQGVVASRSVERLGKWGRPYLGAVTGDNRYFALSAAEAQRWGLTGSDVVPISPPGSRHLRGFEFAKGAWEESRSQGKRCWLFCPAEGEESPGAEAYIEWGEQHGVDDAYKCRVREPWYTTPLTPVADLFLTYMDQERPRLTSNSAGVHHLNSLYGVRLEAARRDLGRELLPIAALNTVSLLSAEVVGRSYGGGLLKLEPTEAEQLALPSFRTVFQLKDELRAARPIVAGFLRSGHLWQAVEAVDSIILERGIGLDTGILGSLRAAREFLFQRRSLRSRAVGEAAKEQCGSST